MLIKITKKATKQKKKRQNKGRAKKAKDRESWAHRSSNKDRNNENCLDTIWLCMSI